MKRIVVVLAVILLAGCYEVKNNNTTIINNNYLDSNTALAENNLAPEKEEDPNYGTISFHISFGDPNNSLSKRGRLAQDLFNLVSRAQAKKVTFIEGHIYSDSRDYYFHIEGDNQDNDIEVEIGDYLISVHAFITINDERSYPAFSGYKKIKVKKGQNDCSMALSLFQSQPIVINLPEGETISECILVDGEQKEEFEFGIHFCPLGDGSQIAGVVPFNLKEMTISYKKKIYTLDSDAVIDSLLFDEIIFLDELESEDITFVNMNLEPEENKLIAGSRNIVLVFKIRGMGEAKITSFQFGLDGSGNDVEDIILIQEGPEVDMELGNSFFENNTATIEPPSPVEILDEEEKIFILEAYIPLSATPKNSISFKLNGVGTVDTVELKQISPSFVIALNGSLIANLIASWSDSIVLAGSTNKIMSLNLLSRNEDISLESLTVNVNDSDYCGGIEGEYRDVRKVIICKEGDHKIAEAFIPSTGKYTFNFPSKALIISRNSKRSLSLSVNMSTIDPVADNAPGTANADIKISIDNIKATGLSSGRSVDVIENDLESNILILRTGTMWVGESRSHDPLGAATTLSNGNICINTTEIYANPNGEDVLIYKLTYEIETDVNLSNWRLDDQYGNTVSVEVYSGYTGGKSITVSFYLDNPDFDAAIPREAIKIPSGEERYFYLYATITGASTGSYLSTRLVGDDECEPMDTADNIEGNFVWSDNHKGLSISNGENNAVNAVQWYNGHLLYGYGFGAPYTISY